MPNYKPVMVLDQSLLGKNFKIKWQSSKNKEAGYRALHTAHVSCSMKAWRVEKSKRGTSDLKLFRNFDKGEALAMKGLPPMTREFSCRDFCLSKQQQNTLST